MGFDVATFYYILGSGFQDQWNMRSIQCIDGKPDAIPYPGQRLLDVEEGLRLALHYLSSTMCEIGLQQIFMLIL